MRCDQSRLGVAGETAAHHNNDEAEYIEREALLNRIQDVYCAGCNSYDGVICKACGTGDAIDMIEDAPAADVAPVRRGKWIFGKDLPEHIGTHPKNKWHLFCSCCHHQALNLTIDNDDTQDVETDFCPFCGARMTEDNDE